MCGGDAVVFVTDLSELISVAETDENDDRSSAAEASQNIGEGDEGVGDRMVADGVSVG